MSRKSLQLMAVMSVLSGCVGAPAALPEDTTGINRKTNVTADSFSESDRAMDCATVAAERTRLATELALVEETVRKQHGSNQVAYFVGGPLLAPVIGARGNDGENIQIRDIFARRDTLVKLSAFKNCP